MCSHLAKRVIAHSSCFYSLSQFQNLPLLTPLLRSSLSTQTLTQPEPQKELPFIAECLISSFGFSFERAVKYSASSNLAAIKSPARPEAVVKFLRDTGLTDAQIKAVISFQPILLGYNVDKTFKPKVRELINGGYSGELLVQLIRYNPSILYLNGTVSRLHFWRDFIGKDDQAFFRIIQKSKLLITRDVDKCILPKINLLREYGLSNADILLLLQHGTRFVGKTLDSLRSILELIEELGTPRGSTKFRSALKVAGGMSEDTIERKVEFFKNTYGWSQEDVNSAFSKYPTVLSYSENKVKSNMGFLLGKAGFEPRTMASYPALIGYSLQRVLIPRYTVLCTLEDKGMNLKCSFPTACSKSERSFYERYVVPFDKDLPGLGQAYEAAKGWMV